MKEFANMNFAELAFIVFTCWVRWPCPLVQESSDDEKALRWADVLIKSDSAATQREALGVFGEMGPAATAAVPRLINAFAYNQPQGVKPQRCVGRDGEYYSMALARIGEKAVPQLAEALSHPNADIRACVAYTLGKFGGSAKSASPKVAELLKDKVAYVRVSAAIALWRIDEKSDQVVPVLADVAVASDVPLLIRGTAVDALGAMGPRAEAAAPALKRILKQKNPFLRPDDSKWIRNRVGDALKSIDVDSKE